jgi:competence protein ComEC
MLALAPLSFAVFGSLSLAGLLVNLLAIPLISFALVPLVLTGALAALAWPGTCGPWFELAGYLHELAWPALVRAADMDGALWRVQPQDWWFGLAMPAGFLLLWRWPWALRLPAACLLLPLVFAPSRLPAVGEARVIVLDAGRGSAALILTHRRAWIFDTGDGWNTHGSRAARVLLPALDAFDVRHIERLILPRLDADRSRAAALLAHERGVGAILVGGAWPGTSLPARGCRDQRFSADGVRFEIFVSRAGATACLLRVSAHGQSILFAGDLDQVAEASLLARVGAPALSSQVVLMARGASSQASGRKWIEAIGAELAVAAGGSAGTASRNATLERWQASGARVLDVQREGAIDILLGEQGFAVLARARGSRHPFAWRRVQ